MQARDHRKQFTCYYWSLDKCKFDDDTCLYAHHDTGKIARSPKKTDRPVNLPKPAKPNGLMDLISLSEDEYMAELEASEPKPKSMDFRAESRMDSRTSSTPPSKKSEARISAETVIDAIQSGIEHDTIKELLESHTPFSVKEAIRSDKDGHSAIFAAIERGDSAIIGLLVQHGANPNATTEESGIPTLAYAVLKGASKTLTVKTLLSLGADPFVMPRELWDDAFLNGKVSAANHQESKIGWCSDTLRVSLSKRLDLAMKHYIYQASVSDTPSKIYEKIAGDLGMKSLIRAPYNLIGQRPAIDLVTRYMRLHLMAGGKGPLVMAFMGPSGHGKSELARYMGDVISLQNLVRKAKMNPNIPRNKPPRAESEGRFIVYIDSLDKNDYAGLIALLDAPEQFVYRDMKTGQIISSADMIFVFTTTHGEKEIGEFCKFNRTFSEQVSLPNIHESGILGRQLNEELQKQFGASLASRVHCVVPFIPFTKSEAAVLAHQYLNDTRQNLCKSKALTYTEGYKRNVQLVIENMAEVCTYLADYGYDPKFGARSIEQAVLKYIQVPLIDKFMKHQLSSQSENSEDTDLVFTIELDRYEKINISIN